MINHKLPSRSIPMKPYSGFIQQCQRQIQQQP